ncbi:MAG: carboxypeptidase regulatory-like domain-containing protein [Desulfuromonadales bacterium]|nr:carboxypeptidase regulatory-like domain-containing protein [Desulfuromonadales bacterium]
MKAFVVDLSICNGCYCCQISCKDEHVANDWTPYAAPQPDTGQFWVKVNEEIRGTVPKVKISYAPMMCLHCDDAKCMKECSSGAISRRADGMIVIDPTKCVGCKLCPDTCPNGMIYFNENLNISQKCTGCSHLIDDNWDHPRCVDSCPTGALKYGEESELQELIAKAEPLKAHHTSGRVYYLNVPKGFVAGTLYDPIEKEVLIGATCTLVEQGSNQTRTVETDNFGDFWFKDLPREKREYTLTLEKDGKKKVIPVETTKDVNLGDIPM